MSNSAPVDAKSQLSTLPNGVRVISENTHAKGASLGVFVGTGSRDEVPGAAGAAKMTEAMAYASSKGNTQFGFHHEVEALGGVLNVQASREDIVYGVDCGNAQTGAMLEVLADSVLNPDFRYHEVEDEKPRLKSKCAAAMDNSNQVVTEAAHVAAFGASGLGNTIAPTHSKLAALSEYDLGDFHTRGFTAGNIVVAGAGVEHDKFVKQVEAAFGSVSGSAPAKTASPYTGGQYCIAGEPTDGMTHVVLGFNGASWNSDNLIATCVLHTLMGGGGSFSAGGPGKGMYSRLYLQVLNQHHWVQNATALNSPYTDSGLFGIFGSSMGADAPALVQVLADQLAKMAGPVTDEELSRAKAMTKSSVLMNLESQAILLEDLGKQVLCYGKRVGAPELTAQIDKVTAADLQKVAKEMLSTPLTYAAYGETQALPRYDVVANSIN